MSTFPFSAIVGADDMALALILTSVSPEVGGVLVRGEKGTAKSTMVRGLDDVLPRQQVVAGCRFNCDPSFPDVNCPDGPHIGFEAQPQDGRLVELPVGATEDRVVGSLDLREALGHGRATFEPGLLAQAHRGILYVDEVNLLHDHLVDLLLDAAAMGRNTVEREGISVTHPAQLILIGTMNPEEGELRPQLLDRFGLTVEVSAPRDPALRVDVVRRRMAFDADPDGFLNGYAARQQALRDQLAQAQKRVLDVTFSDAALELIAVICAAFDVDGMRADLVMARAAVAHAAWVGRDEVTKADIRVAAKLALPHRRRRNPFDAPGLDEALLDQLLGPDDPEPEPPTDDDPPPPDERPGDRDLETEDGPDQSAPDTPPTDDHALRDQDPPLLPEQLQTPDATVAGAGSATGGVSAADAAYRTRLLQARGLGEGDPGRRSRALTSSGRRVGARPWRGEGHVHLPATVRAAACQADSPGTLTIRKNHLRQAITEGRESNLVLFCVDASGSMAARNRMGAVKTAILSLLLDAYQRRDKVGLVAFRRHEADILLPPTHSVDAASRRLAEMPHGGRTPLAEGLAKALNVVERERLRDPRRRALLIVVTDGRATSGKDPLVRAHKVAEALRGVDTVVVDCEQGKMRLGLAEGLAATMGADYIPVAEVGADTLVAAVDHYTSRRVA